MSEFAWTRRPSFSREDFRDVFGFYPGDPNNRAEATKVEICLQRFVSDFGKKEGRLKAVLHDSDYSDRSLYWVKEAKESFNRSWNRACELAESFGYHVPSALKPGFRKSA